MDFAPLTRGFAPGPLWGHIPQTPIIGSRSELANMHLRSGLLLCRNASLIIGLGRATMPIVLKWINNDMNYVR